MERFLHRSVSYDAKAGKALAKTRNNWSFTMTEHVYKTLEITGSSELSIEDAVQTAVSRTQESVHNLRWFEVTDIRGHIEQGKVSHWQVTAKLGITLDPPEGEK